VRLGRGQGDAGAGQVAHRPPDTGHDAGYTRTCCAGVEQGTAFLLGTDPALAEYPNGYSDKPSGNWWKFGFPDFYITDLLQNVEALVALGYSRDPRLAGALDIIREKQDAGGRWSLQHDYAGKTWCDVGSKKQPNP
jgi:hypothetical protein